MNHDGARRAGSIGRSLSIELENGQKLENDALIFAVIAGAKISLRLLILI